MTKRGKLISVPVLILVSFLLTCKGYADKPLVLMGTLIDGTGKKPVRNGVLIIKGKHITAAGPETEIKIPVNAKVFRFPNASLLPGFINTHVHSRYNEKLLETWAREGVTTVRDLGAAANLDWFTLRDKRRTNPKYARIAAAGPIVSIPGGFIKEVSLNVTSPEDAEQKINKLVDQGADVIKIGLNSPLNPEMSWEIAAKIVKTAHARNIRVAAHVISTQGLRTVLKAGVDDINHLAVFGYKSDRLIKQMVDAGIYWIPTFDASPPPFRKKGMNAFERFIKAGGKTALGNDSGSLRGVQVGMPLREMEWMQKAGMTRMQIIVASTGHAAEVCGLKNELGTLEKGKLADVLVVTGNPLQDLQILKNVQMVIHEGVIIRSETSRL